MPENGAELSALLNSMITSLGPWVGRVLGAIAVLVIGWMMAGWVRRLARRGMERSRLDRAAIPFLTAAVYWTAMAFVVVAVLGLFGIPTASFVAVLGAAGLAVGLAFQGTLSNLASGVMLLIFRPFDVGDTVEIDDTLGVVEEIRLMYTELTTPDGVQTLVPNGEILGAKISNYTANPTRRVDLVVGVGYGDDLDAAEETIRRVLATDERVLEEPEPLVQVDELGGSSVNFVVRPWCRAEDYWALKRDLTRKLKGEIEAAGLEFPYPQRDVHLFQEG
jgi:small conductance mechanosensitive channel